MKGMTVATAKWTVQDYHRMISAGILDDRRVELLNGEIIELSPEGPEHYYSAHTTAGYLRRILGDGVDVRENGPITLPNDSEPEPDIAVVADLGRVYQTRHPYPADIKLLLEFANSSLRKDTQEKRVAYAGSGVLEYWVVDLQAKGVRVYRDPVLSHFFRQALNAPIHDFLITKNLNSKEIVTE